MKNITYFCEGETEEALLNFLKHTDNKKIRPGKVKKFNLWQGKIGKILKMLPRKTELYFIIDTDTVTSIQLFKDNLEKLKRHKVYLIVQNKNLEDELRFSCAKSNNAKMYKDFYQVSSSSKFKSKFINEGNLKNKLEGNNFDFEKLWSRGAEFKKFLEENYINVNITWRQ